MNNSARTIKSHCFDGLTVGTTLFQKDLIEPCLHYHNTPVGCFMLEGGVLETRNGNSYDRNAGDARFFHAGELHKSVVKVFPSKCIHFEFDFNFLNRYEVTEDIINVAFTESLDIRFLMFKIYNELRTNDGFTNSSIKMILLSMFDEKKRLNNCHPPVWVKTLDELLNDCWDKTLGLEDLSSVAKVHPVTVSRCFTNYFSCSLGEYRRKIKVSKSIALIKNTKMSLTEIGVKCGFADQSHFNRCFKEFTGFTPKTFRQIF